VSRIYTEKKREGVEALSMTRGARKWTWRAAIGPGVLCLTEKESKQRGGAEQSDGGDVVRLRRYGGHSVGEGFLPAAMAERQRRSRTRGLELVLRSCNVATLSPSTLCRHLNARTTIACQRRDL